MKTETIYLGYRTEPISITIEAYARILDLVENHRACTKCGMIFETDNPCVALNTCLSCYLARHSGITFLGLLDEGQYHSTYGYINESGIVYTSYAGNDRSSERSDYYTLKHWGFLLPETDLYRGQEIKLHGEYWHFYGDPVHNEAVIVTWKSGYNGGDLCYIAYKDGILVELNKRSKENKALYKRAEQLAESYKNDAGYYLIGDSSRDTLSEYALYWLIAEIATNEYRVKVREEKEVRVNELVHNWLKGNVDDNALFEIIELYTQLGDPRNVARFQKLLETDVALADNDQQTTLAEA